MKTRNEFLENYKTYVGLLDKLGYEKDLLDDLFRIQIKNLKEKQIRKINKYEIKNIIKNNDK